MDKLDKLYAQVAQESDEHNSPNTRMGQRLVAWLNRYLGDTDRTTRAKPSKNHVVSHMLTKWRPPAWVTSCGKNKREEYRKAHQAAHDGTRTQCGAPPPPSSFVPEVQQPPATSVSSSVLEAPQPPATSSLTTAPATVRPQLFRVMTTSWRELPPYVPPLYLTWRSHNTNRQDGLPKGAPGWGDKLTEWRDFIHRLCCSKTTKKFLGIQVEADPGFIEPPSNRRLRGFVLKGYFAPHFQYDSNRNGWCHNFTRLFAVPGRYRAIVKREGWVIVPGHSSQWTEVVDQAPSPLTIAGYLTQNGLSFQEADDLYKWATAALHEDAMGQEANADITSDLPVAGTSVEGPGQSLEYYEERVEQGGSQLEFQDIESLPGDALSLLRVKEAARYLPAPPQKKKRCSHRKMTDTDEEDSYSSFGEDSLGSDNGGPPWNPPKDDQMDIDTSGPSQM